MVLKLLSPLCIVLVTAMTAENSANARPDPRADYRNIIHFLKFTSPRDVSGTAQTSDVLEDLRNHLVSKRNMFMRLDADHSSKFCTEQYMQ